MTWRDTLPSVRGKLLRDEPLGPYTWFRVGGAADALFIPADAEDLADFLKALDPAVPVTILGVGSNVIVRDGIVHLSGMITDERSRQASVVAAQNVAGVIKVHDHLCWVDTMSGMYLKSPEDIEMAKAG